MCSVLDCPKARQHTCNIGANPDAPGDRGFCCGCYKDFRELLGLVICIKGVSRVLRTKAPEFDGGLKTCPCSFVTWFANHQMPASELGYTISSEGNFVCPHCAKEIESKKKFDGDICSFIFSGCHHKHTRDLTLFADHQKRCKEKAKIQRALNEAKELDLKAKQVALEEKKAAMDAKAAEKKAEIDAKLETMRLYNEAQRLYNEAQRQTTNLCHDLLSQEMTQALTQHAQAPLCIMVYFG